MELKQLRYFIKIAELQNVTQAAEELGISQPALGIHVRNLEAELDTQLLVRHSRGVELTEAGLVLVAKARTLLHAASELKRVVADQTGIPRGIVNLGMTPSSSHLVAAELIKRVALEMPSVEVRIMENSSTVLAEWLVKERLDMALCYDSGPMQQFERDVLLMEDLYFLSPRRNKSVEPGTEINFTQVLQTPLILPGPDDSVRREIDRVAREHGAKANVSMEMKSSAIVCDLVKEGLGSTVLPSELIKRYADLQYVAVRRIVNPVISRELSLLRPKLQSMSLAQSYLVKLLRALVKERWNAQLALPLLQRPPTDKAGKSRP